MCRFACCGFSLRESPPGIRPGRATYFGIRITSLREVSGSPLRDLCWCKESGQRNTSIRSEFLPETVVPPTPQCTRYNSPRGSNSAIFHWSRIPPHTEAYFTAPPVTVGSDASTRCSGLTQDVAGLPSFIDGAVKYASVYGDMRCSSQTELFEPRGELLRKHGRVGATASSVRNPNRIRCFFAYFLCTSKESRSPCRGEFPAGSHAVRYSPRAKRHKTSHPARGHNPHIHDHCRTGMTKP
jgi:hypothetical protein